MVHDEPSGREGRTSVTVTLDPRTSRAATKQPAHGAAPALRYLSGFGNEHVTEALLGTLPEGQNSPQKSPRGLYPEQLSGTAFTAPRAQNRRSWLYRIRPAAMHHPFRRIDNGLWRSAPFTEIEASPNRLRWD